jgi:hypothetical protein
MRIARIDHERRTGKAVVVDIHLPQLARDEHPARCCLERHLQQPMAAAQHAGLAQPGTAGPAHRPAVQPTGGKGDAGSDAEEVPPCQPAQGRPNPFHLRRLPAAYGADASVLRPSPNPDRWTDLAGCRETS